MPHERMHPILVQEGHLHDLVGRTFDGVSLLLAQGARPVHPAIPYVDPNAVCRHDVWDDFGVWSPKHLVGRPGALRRWSFPESALVQYLQENSLRTEVRFPRMFRFEGF